MNQFILSPEAKSSLKNIRTYSLKNFGSKRTKTYLQSIYERFKKLAKTPSAGTIRTDLNTAYYSDFIGSHTIYYRIKTTHIDIIDVLHQSMEPSKHISN